MGSSTKPSSWKWLTSKNYFLKENKIDLKKVLKTTFHIIFLASTFKTDSFVSLVSAIFLLAIKKLMARRKYSYYLNKHLLPELLFLWWGHVKHLLQPLRWLWDATSVVWKSSRMTVKYLQGSYKGEALGKYRLTSFPPTLCSWAEPVQSTSPVPWWQKALHSPINKIIKICPKTSYIFVPFPLVGKLFHSLIPLLILLIFSWNLFMASVCLFVHVPTLFFLA